MGTLLASKTSSKKYPIHEFSAKLGVSVSIGYMAPSEDLGDGQSFRLRRLAAVTWALVGGSHRVLHVEGNIEPGSNV